jgi:GTP cyclohydrolase I
VRKDHTRFTKMRYEKREVRPSARALLAYLGEDVQKMERGCTPRSVETSIASELHEGLDHTLCLVMDERAAGAGSIVSDAREKCMKVSTGTALQCRARAMT